MQKKEKDRLYEEIGNKVLKKILEQQNARITALEHVVEILMRERDIPLDVNIN